MKYYGGIALVVVAMVVMALVLRHGSASSKSTNTTKTTTTTHVAASNSTKTNSSTTRKSTSKTTAAPVASGGEIVVSDLPAEAQHTLDLIAAGGPYPYSRDGVVFSNFDGHLPIQKSGYYHEYTVVTPGESDRGARRIITGKNGERYYTSDHYASFAVVVEG